MTGYQHTVYLYVVTHVPTAHPVAIYTTYVEATAFATQMCAHDHLPGATFRVDAVLAPTEKR